MLSGAEDGRVISVICVKPVVKVVFIKRRVGKHFSVTVWGGSQFSVSPLELFPAPWTHGSPAVACIRITWGIE